MIIPSNITWFDDDDYIGLELAFPKGSTWKLDKKIQEHEDIYGQTDHEEGGIISEARAAFIGSKVSGEGPSTAVIKIHMQIPWWGSAGKKPSIRAKQAISDTPSRGEMEVEALSTLTTAGCSSAPSLIDWMQREQTQDQWVPGGYIHFVVMEMVPGVDVSSVWNRMERDERDELRAAFKKSWLECTACGVISRDSGLQNLLWDRARKKCYLIDWEMYRPARQRDRAWSDRNYIRWNLARKGESGDYNDMSTWIL
ncbi:hypothetical protein BO78DRAFT_351264 [Aspergillus sclerotiicarbonarius CBS 121057]|uniref:Protein kinase domain-containing protein n=1 Tax=Aspergillus sclerotiicarbonarius (strain CBS 121057 / IBT 28362) TaxID=1448318 RepID=A0A319E7L6_ASPSB|nr:hypothetical protein BO78DRAFT_351264 [Aspergillus sclerotiicarbonarius CBS 121057]